MKIGIRPLNDRVVIEPIDQKATTDGGVVIPDTVQDKVQEGNVVGAGPRAPASLVRTRARVIYSKYSGCEVTIDDRTYVIISAKEVLARVYAGNHAH